MNNLSKICTEILLEIGEDPQREGLKETPRRFAESFRFWCSGYGRKAEDVIKVFDNPGTDQLIIIPKIDFYSLCEHHLVPFFGEVNIGYIPDKKILGLSKFSRLVDIYARRLQIQERLTHQIASDIQKFIRPKGVAVMISAAHLCIQSRGVEKNNSNVITTSVTGRFRKSGKLREEFFSMVKKSGKRT